MKVKSSGATSTDFKIDTGVKQGCVLAPSLFSLYLTAISWVTFKDDDPGVPFSYRFDGRLLNIKRSGAKGRLHSTRVHIMLFIDDDVLLAHRVDELQVLATKFLAAFDQLGLHINVNKTFVVQQPSCEGHSNNPGTISIGRNVIENLSDFSYLGSVLTNDLWMDRKLTARVAKAILTFRKLERCV